MAEESQVWPLAPSRIRSDEENPTFKAIRRERSNKCFVYVFTAIVIQSIFILVFALLVLRVKSPDLKIRSVTVRTLKYSTSPSSFNATLVAQVTIKNTNFGHYKFESSSASILYDGAKVGSSKVGKGRAKARETTRVSVVVEVRSSRLPEGANSLGTDIGSGVLKLSVYAKLSGRVHLIKVINKRKTVQMNCTMNLVLKNKTIKDLVCI